MSQQHFLVGGTVALTATFKDRAGAAMTPGGVKFTIRPPGPSPTLVVYSGGSVVPEAAVPGAFTALHVVAVPGRHWVRAECLTPIVLVAPEGEFMGVESRVLVV